MRIKSVSKFLKGELRLGSFERKRAAIYDLEHNYDAVYLK